MSKHQIVKCDKCGIALQVAKAKEEGFVTVAIIPIGSTAHDAKMTDLCGECSEPIPVYLEKKVNGAKKGEEEKRGDIG